MTFSTTLSDSCIRVIEEHKASVEQHVKAVQSQLSEVTRHQKIWSDLISFIKKDWPQHILFLFKREAPFFDKIEAENPVMKEALQEIKKLSQDKVESNWSLGSHLHMSSNFFEGAIHKKGEEGKTVRSQHSTS